MKKTKIQWCHSTVNPVMGCDGCELWPGKAKVVAEIQEELQSANGAPGRLLSSVVRRAVDGRAMSALYRDRESVAAEIQSALALPNDAQEAVVDVIRRRAKCYAGFLGTLRAGHEGYADEFESPKLFPDRMEEAARWGAPTELETASKPWLAGLPRLIFISDMGDALSNGVSFDFLRQEIVDNVKSVAGQRHIWLWLSKRPNRMADFGTWLAERGTPWPINLVAMATVTAQSNAGRVEQLRNVPSKLKGLSLEPLFEPVDLDLTGIDWVIVGGGSDALAEPFHVEWALEFQERCSEANAAFFLKQLGKNPLYQNRSLDLLNKHGGDWNEWPKEWRVRNFPGAFRSIGGGVFAENWELPIDPAKAYPAQWKGWEDFLGLPPKRQPRAKRRAP